MKYITKCDYAHAIGYNVRVPEINNGIVTPYNRQVNGFFFRKGTGTWKECLVAAIKWRDDYFKANNSTHLINEIKNNAHPRANFSSNTSGIIGVSLVLTIKNYNEHYAFIATWSENKKPIKKSYSVVKHGYKGAFKKACRTHYDHAGVLIITDRNELPCLPKQEYIIQ